MTAATTAAADEHLCRDCGARWSAKAAADECEILDAAEARQARREKG